MSGAQVLDMPPERKSDRERWAGKKEGRGVRKGERERKRERDKGTKHFAGDSHHRAFIGLGEGEGRSVPTLSDTEKSSWLQSILTSSAGHT